jgi:hypothetical protein
MANLPDTSAASLQAAVCCTADAACSLSSDQMQAILRDPATSPWLRRAFAELQVRDPLDALNDAQLLHRAMCTRFSTLMREVGHGQAGRG